MKMRDPLFQFISIQLNKDYASRLHVGRYNLGPSYLTALGDFTGGELWLEGPTGQIPVLLPERVGPTYKKGQTYYGHALKTRHKWLRFDGRRLHGTMPFEGERYSFIFYSCCRADQVEPEIRDQLQAVGFPLPNAATTKAAVAAAAKPEPAWIIDSGAGEDLISRADAEQLGVPLQPSSRMFQTANGAIKGEGTLQLFVPLLQEYAMLHVLRDCPSVLSLGKRIREGWGFVWR